MNDTSDRKRQCVKYEKNDYVEDLEDAISFRKGWIVWIISGPNLYTQVQSWIKLNLLEYGL